MDQAFMPGSEVFRQMVSIDADFTDEAAGFRMYVDRLEIELPVELSIGRDADGRLEIGSTPPLYAVDTSFRPSFHRVRITAVAEERDGE